MKNNNKPKKIMIIFWKKIKWMEVENEMKKKMLTSLTLNC